MVDTVYLGSICLGATGVDIRRIGKSDIKVNWEVIGYRPPTLLILTFGPPVGSIARFSFRPTPTGGIRLTSRTTMMPKGWIRITSPFIVPEARQTDEKRLARVKSNMESRQAHRSKGAPNLLAGHSR